MLIKCFDEQHEDDLTEKVNAFIKNVQVIDIKFSSSGYAFQDEQIYCFSALVMYIEKETVKTNDRRSL